MTYRYKLHPLAQEEYESSVSWYIKRSLKTASNFVKTIDEAFVKIYNDPKRNRNEYSHYFEFTVQKYPFYHCLYN